MSSSPPEPLAAPLSLVALLDGALRRLRQHARALYLPFAVPLVLLGALQPIVQLTHNPVMRGRSADPSSFLGQMALLYGLMLVIGLFYGLTYVAIVVAATDAVAGRSVAAGRAWLAALDPRMLGTQLLTWLACLGGLLFCILPGIYVGLSLSIVVAVMAEERLFGTGALRRSWRLMRRPPGAPLGESPRLRSLLLIVVGSLIGWATSFIVQLPFTAVMMFVLFRAAAAGRAGNPEQAMAPVMWLQVPANMLGALVQTVVLLYTAFGITLLYFDVRRRTEGQDLLVEAERLAQGREPATS